MEIHGQRSWQMCGVSVLADAPASRSVVLILVVHPRSGELLLELRLAHVELRESLRRVLADSVGVRAMDRAETLRVYADFSGPHSDPSGPSCEQPGMSRIALLVVASDKAPLHAAVRDTPSGERRGGPETASYRRGGPRRPRRSGRVDSSVSTLPPSLVRSPSAAGDRRREPRRRRWRRSGEDG